METDSQKVRGDGAQDQAGGPRGSGHTGGEAAWGEALQCWVGGGGSGGGGRALSPGPRAAAPREGIAGAPRQGDRCCRVRCCHSPAETLALGSSPLRPLQSGGCPLGGPSSEITGDVPGPGEGQEQREARWQLSLSVSIVRRFPEPSCPQKQWRWTHVTSRVPLQNEAMEKQLIDPGLVPAPGHSLPLAGHPACLHASFHISLVVSMPRRQ